MKTNFFTQVARMEITGDLKLTIKKATDTTYIVSVILNNDGCGDKAKHLIPPLNFTGTPEELDGGFFPKITEPIKAVSGLMVDMESFLKQVEEAKRQSAMETKKTEKEKKEKDAKAKKYEKALAQVDELEKEGRYREAWTKLPNPDEYPQQAETIRKRRRELSAKFAPDLFAAG